MKNVNITIKTVLDMFGESERCIMHKNTAPIDIIEKFLTNDELDALVGKSLKEKIQS
jgi:hypothetical protein